MRRQIYFDELHDHVTDAQKALLQEKEDIIDQVPPGRVVNREEYAFCYVRAERFGMLAINQKLENIDWLPLHVDPSPEMLGKKRHPLNRWIMSYAATEPDATEFGNDFMHALTRVALHHGWNSTLFLRTTARIAQIFHDLMCLLNAAYFLAVMAENHVESVSINMTDNVQDLVAEMARIIQRPEIYVISRRQPGSRHHGNLKPHSSHRARKHPHLRIVNTDHDSRHPAH